MQSEEQQVVIKLSEHQDEFWKAFSSYTTEMVVTKRGRSLFPQIEYDIKGLNPNKYYAMIFEFQRVDDYRYKYVNDKWEKLSDTVKSMVYYRPKKIAHCHEIKSGEHWMENHVNFSQVKLTTNSSHEGSSHIFLPTLHMYVPVLSIHEMDREKRVIIEKPVAVKRIEYTKFMAVSSYNNQEVVSLKIAKNKYAKGFRFSEPNDTDSLSPVLKRVRYEKQNNDNTASVPSSSAQVQPMQMSAHKLTEQITYPVTPLRTLENMITDKFFETNNILQQSLMKQENCEVRDFSANDNLPVLQKFFDKVATTNIPQSEKVDNLVSPLQNFDNMLTHPQLLKRKNDESGNFSASDSTPILQKFFDELTPANTPQSEKETSSQRCSIQRSYEKGKMEKPSTSKTVDDCQILDSKLHEAPQLTPYWMTTKEKIRLEKEVSQPSFSNKNKTPSRTGQSSSKSKKKSASWQLKPSPKIETSANLAAGQFPIMPPHQAMSLYSQYALLQAAAIAPYFMNFGASFPPSPQFSPMFQHLSAPDNSEKENDATS